ncbi:MAG TPA: FAD-dependent oxidoreductase [Rhizomicrobium sp.]|nr:FAD-dependent oxidoreductase [Rhizomicrobium sp.]
MDRRYLLKNSLALGGLVGLGGCATPPRAPAAKAAPNVPIEDRVPPLAPIRAHTDRLFDIKVCIRPFRTKGPNLDVEQIGDAMVLHNYGHGGSGWSLSWGSANMAVQKAMSASPKQIAVIGCGIIGLTSAITAQRAGAQVTIYARELLPRTRSVRANGSWTPDSRISLAAEAPANFGATWEEMARMSWKTLRSYLGLPGNPVTFTDHYRLSDTPFGQPVPPDPSIPPLPPPTWAGAPTQESDFGTYADRIGDLTPKSQVLTDDNNPFPVKHVSRTTQMFFNFTEYGQLLMSNFYAAGGKIVMRDFHTPGELADLPEKVIINCPGYAAHDWWKDKAMVPVRGQTGWLIPQPEVNYAMTYRNVQILSKSDGIMVIALEHGDLKGYNDSDESVRRAESERAVRVIEELYSRFPSVPA